MHRQNPWDSTAGTIKQIVIYFGLFLAGDLCSSIALDVVFSAVPLPESWMYLAVRSLAALLLTWLLFWLYTVKILHLPMSSFRITFSIKGWAAACAFLLPAAVAAFYLVVGTQAVYPVPPGTMVGVIVSSLLFALSAGIKEEMLFRGYMMTLIERRWNKWAAILVPSILFGCAHLLNMEAYSLSGVLLLLASGSLVGIMFSLAADRGGSIGSSAVIHTVWNLVMVTDLLHITTAEGAYGSPLLSVIIPSENILLTGGGFGMEASLVSAVGYGAVCCFLARKRSPAIPPAA